MHSAIFSQSRLPRPVELHRSLAVGLLLSALLHSSPASAAIVVDPLSTGATDVSFGTSGPGTTVANPVPDPFNAQPSQTVLALGRTLPGALEINGGSQAKLVTVWIGAAFPGADGLLTVTGAGSKLTTTSNMQIGGHNTGRFDVLDGATADVREIQLYSNQAGEHSEVNLSGANTLLDIGFSIGVGSGGVFTTSGGAALEADGVSIGNSVYDNNSPAAVATIDGGDSTWNIQRELRIGEFGDGSLTISSGAEVYAAATRLGNYTASMAPLTLSNGTLRTDALYFSGGQIIGTGNVFAKGMVADLDLTFDASQGLVRQFAIAGQPGVNVELDVTQPGTLGAGYRGNGTLRIADGLLINSAAGVLGDRAGSFGKATIEGAGSKWHVDGELKVGVEGVGELEIGTGAEVEVNGAFLLGKNFQGPPSRLQLNGGVLAVGVLSAATDQLLGNGTIRTAEVHLDGNLILDQPTVTQSTLVLNDLAGQNVTIDFGDSQSGVLGVGFRDSGAIEIRNGAKVHSAMGYLGNTYESRGSALVTGAGSEWQIVEDLQIGTSYEEAASELRVLDGGVVAARRVTLNAASVIEVAGADSQLQGEQLDINGYHNAYLSKLHVHSGGVAEFDSVSNFGSGYPVGEILVEGSGSRLQFSQNANLSGVLVRVRDGAELSVSSENSFGGGISLGSGAFHLDGGTVNLYGGGISAQDGSFILERGIVKDIRAFSGNLLQLGGRLEVGFDQLDVTGAYFQDADGALQVGFLSDGPGAHVPVRVNGVASLEGTLEVVFQGDLPTMVGTPQGIYPVLEATRGILGSFENYVLPELAVGLGWSIRQTADYLNLEVIAGDYNGDLVVDAADYTVWRNMRYEHVAKGSGADGDRNGYIDQQDYYLWKSFFGRRVVRAATGRIAVGDGAQQGMTAAVPEPANFLLLITAGFSLLSVARRRLV